MHNDDSGIKDVKSLVHGSKGKIIAKAAHIGAGDMDARKYM